MAAVSLARLPLPLVHADAQWSAMGQVFGPSTRGSPISCALGCTVGQGSGHEGEPEGLAFSLLSSLTRWPRPVVMDSLQTSISLLSQAARFALKQSFSNTEQRITEHYLHCSTLPQPLVTCQPLLIAQPCHEPEQYQKVSASALPRLAAMMTSHVPMCDVKRYHHTQ